MDYKGGKTIKRKIKGDAKREKYAFERCIFYKLHSISRLCKMLGVSRDDLDIIIKKKNEKMKQYFRNPIESGGYKELKYERNEIFCKSTRKHIENGKIRVMIYRHLK